MTGRLVEHAPRRQHRFRCAFHVKSILAVQDVAKNETRVMMTRRNQAWRKSQLEDRSLPTCQSDIRQILLVQRPHAERGVRTAGRKRSEERVRQAELPEFAPCFHESQSTFNLVR